MGSDTHRRESPRLGCPMTRLFVGEEKIDDGHSSPRTPKGNFVVTDPFASPSKGENARLAEINCANRMQAGAPGTPPGPPGTPSHPFRKAFLRDVRMSPYRSIHVAESPVGDSFNDCNDTAHSAEKTHIRADGPPSAFAFTEISECTPIPKLTKYKSRMPLHLENLNLTHGQTPVTRCTSLDGFITDHSESSPSTLESPPEFCSTPNNRTHPFLVQHSPCNRELIPEDAPKFAGGILSEFIPLQPAQELERKDSPSREQHDEHDDFSEDFCIRTSMAQRRIRRRSSITMPASLMVPQSPHLFQEFDANGECREDDVDDHGTYAEGVRLSFGCSGKDLYFAPDQDAMAMDLELTSRVNTPKGSFSERMPWSSANNLIPFGSPPSAPERVNNKSHKEHLMGRQDFTPMLQRAASVLRYEIHYETVELLGKGSFGEVYSARHHRTNKMFALKRTTQQFRGEKDKQMHLREIRSVAVLPQHPNLVRYYRAWQDDGHFYIVMELCTGGTLKHLMEEYHQQGRGLDMEHIRQLSAGLLRGLHRIHGADLLHLDLKPDNLFLTDNKRGIKIGDFGLCLSAKDWDEDEGDREYLAPEILNHTALPQSDIFSAGLIIFQMLTATVKLPGFGDAWHYLRAGNVEFDCHSAGHDIAVEVVRMLAREPSGRPSAGELLNKAAFSVIESPDFSPLISPVPSQSSFRAASQTSTVPPFGQEPGSISPAFPSLRPTLQHMYPPGADRLQSSFSCHPSFSALLCEDAMEVE